MQKNSNCSASSYDGSQFASNNEDNQVIFYENIIQRSQRADTLMYGFSAALSTQIYINDVHLQMTTRNHNVSDAAWMKHNEQTYLHK